ncbi:aldo/keto reductase [Echinicola sp. CAU 1574]|uniref:Aldo/keto reductase n=1 Tax=Echinicola arenosa TaxID=2774144 RepID=A0ABR9ASA9_9BACT|nr:aldo/keto reductase [Echinicola arenosa]MBD8491256.1 aldo/keto reductase [Echinicola arenosa]
MKYNPLGKSDIKISEVSFGCMSLKGSKQHDITLVKKAIDQGINYFDTADLYDAGENERLVGEALKENRSDIILATKVGNQIREDGNGWDWNPSKSYILKAVDKSLARLQTDYIDFYQLHGGTIEDPIDETIEAFEALKEIGKIRAYGISSIRPNVIKSYVDKSNISGVMMQYSMLDRRPEEICLDLLDQKNISVLVRGAYAKGILLGKPAKEYLNWTEEDVAKIKSMLSQKGEGLDAIRKLVLNFPLQHRAVASVVSGIRTESQLHETLTALEIDEELRSKLIEIRNSLPRNVYSAHR